ncbi:MAG: hypothetical protein AB8G95_07910 [Anaerolineae bacterium]
MKRLVLICGLLLTLFLMVACGGTPEPAAVEPQAEAAVEVASSSSIETEAQVEAPEPVVVVEEVAEVEVVEEAESVEVIEVDIEDPAVIAEAEIAIEAAAIVNPTDFNKISQTGRPQFLNSYADW